MMNRTICRCTLVTLSVFISVSGFGQESLTVTREDGTTISVGENTLVEMETSQEGVEMYILTPAVSSELARVTILSPAEGQTSSQQRQDTKASGKKITIWLRSPQEAQDGEMEFLIEGEALVVQGSDRMYSPRSIEFKNRNLRITASEEKEGELLRTFEDGRRVDWQGQEFSATFTVNENGEYVLKGFNTPKPFTRLNFFHPRLKGGMLHLMPLGQSRKAEEADLGKKVSPSQ